MSVALTAGVVPAVLAAGVAVERYAGAAAVRRSLPRSCRDLVGVAALGWGYTAHAVGLIPSVTVAGTTVVAPVVAFALSVALRVGLPFAFAPVVGTRPSEPRRHC